MSLSKQNKVKAKSKTDFTFIDLFSGIGGFRIALEQLGGKCLAFSEIDKTAIEVYKNNFDTSSEIKLGDITKIKNFPKSADLVTGGVPCQSWSVAGKKQGFSDPRGALWFDTINFVKQVKPKAFIFENVKGLADPRNKANLDLILSSLTDLGYKVDYKILNAFDFGLPQNRERIFIVGLHNSISGNFVFPEKFVFLPRLADVLENLSDQTHANIKNNLNIKNSFNISYKLNQGKFFTFCDTRNGANTIHSWDLIDCSQAEREICEALLKNRRKRIYGEKDGNPLSFAALDNLLGGIDLADMQSLVFKKILKFKQGKYDFVNSKNSAGINGLYRVFLPSSHVFSTLTKTGVRDLVAMVDIPDYITDRKKYFLENIYQKGLVRKLTIREAARLQGFPEEYKFTNSYTKNLGLLGNALGVSIAKQVSELLLDFICDEKRKNKFKII